MVYRLFLLILLLFFFNACDEKQRLNLDGKKLIKEKCLSCHNLDLPPKTYEDEKAPPMMAIAFHIKGSIKTNDESLRIIKAVEFVKDYVIYPSASKSFCDKKSLESYGVMPSQKGEVTEDELQAIAEYMFEHYTQKNLVQAQDIENRLLQMSKGQRIALKNNCLNCHKIDKNFVGPSFQNIANRYKNNMEVLRQSIKNGSLKKWNGFRGAMMPKFGDKLSDEEIKILVKWILKVKES